VGFPAGDATVNVSFRPIDDPEEEGPDWGKKPNGKDKWVISPISPMSGFDATGLNRVQIAGKAQKPLPDKGRHVCSSTTSLMSPAQRKSSWCFWPVWSLAVSWKD